MLGPSVENQSAYTNAQITFHAAFMAYLEATKDDPLNALAMELPSNTAQEVHVFLGDIPGFKEWAGDREMGALQAHNLTIRNRDWASGIAIHRNQIVDDKLGLVMPRIQGLAQKAKRHRGQLIAELLLNGFAGTVNFGTSGGPSAEVGDGTCYDGAFMFSHSHTLEGGPNQDNYLGAVALSDSGLESAIKLMRGFKTYDGRDPLEVTPTHLIVGPQLEFMAKRLLNQELRVRYPDDRGSTNTQSGADTNIHKGTLELIVSPRIMDYSGAGGTDYSKYWFLAALNEPVKPFIFQNREPITVASQVTWDTTDMFKRGQMNFGAQARYAVANYDWRLLVGSIGA